MGKIVRSISADGSVVATSIEARDIVQEARRIHVTSPVVTAALGRLLAAASMMGYMLKGDKDSLTLRINGGGEIGSLIAVAASNGNVKGYAENPVVDLPLNAKGKLDVGGAVGTDGMLTVIKDLGMKEPYVGQVPLVSGEIAEDITSYFAVSEQVPTVCALGVLVDTDLSVKAAGGYLIQLLPFAGDECIDLLEKNIQSIPPVTQLLSGGMDAQELALRVLDGFSPNVLDEQEVFYRCDCSKERVQKALISLGREELEKMAQEDPLTEVKCHFCTHKYRFPAKEIAELAKRL